MFNNKLIIPSGTDLWLYNPDDGSNELLKHFDLETGEFLSFYTGFGGEESFYFVVSRSLGILRHNELCKSDGKTSGT